MIHLHNTGTMISFMRTGNLISDQGLVLLELRVKKNEPKIKRVVKKINTYTDKRKPYPKNHLTITISGSKATLQSIVEAKLIPKKKSAPNHTFIILSYSSKSI